MKFSVLEAITALATGLSALFLFMQTRHQNQISMPYITARLQAAESDAAEILLLIFPGDIPVTFTAVSAKNALIAVPKFELHPVHGTSVLARPKSLEASFAAISLEVPPGKTSENPQTLTLLVKSRSNASSVRISLHTRSRFLPTAYSVNARTSWDA